MALAQLRRSGGSTIVAIPPAILDAAGLTQTSTVDIGFDNAAGAVMVRAVGPRYTLNELMAQCDFDAPMSQEDREWLSSTAVGNELI